MDQKSKPSDSLTAETRDRHLPMPWDELLAAVRRAPQRSAVEAARTAQQSPGCTTEALSPLHPADTPTWDGVHTVLNMLHQKDLAPEDLPHTRSATVLLTHLLSELAYSIAGLSKPSRDFGVTTTASREDDARARFEAECLTWIIAGRLGVKAAATGTLKGYLRYGELIPEFSRDRVLQAVDTIEGLFGGALAFAATIREERLSLFDLEGSLAV